MRNMKPDQIKMDITIGICAFNEEGNIAKLLELLLNQRLNKNMNISKIIVVSSGSTDKTDQIVREIGNKNKKVTLYREPLRTGKSMAINIILKEARTEFIVLISADTLPRHDTIQKLCEPLLEKDVGITGGRPRPLKSKNGFFRFMAELEWELHHMIALERPKFGEIIAFRKIIKSIPRTAVDEEKIASIIKKAGMSARYMPSAAVFNQGCSTISDFIRQRRRIFAGHLQLKNESGYEVPTLSSLRIAGYLMRSRFLNNPIYLLGAISLEALARMLGTYDYISRRKHIIWDISHSTKSGFEDQFTIVLEIAGLKLRVFSQDKKIIKSIKKDHAGFITKAKYADSSVNITLAETIEIPAEVIKGGKVVETLEKRETIRVEENNAIIECNIFSGSFNLKDKTGNFTIRDSEYLGIFTRNIIRVCFSILLNPKKGIVLHGSGINARGKGLVFCGPPGAGKSTVAKLAKGHTVLNDEMVVVRKIRGKYRIFGTPFGGELHPSKSSAPLKKIFFIDHGKRLRINRIGNINSIPELMANEFVSFSGRFKDNTDLIKNTFKIAKNICNETECYKLRFSLEDRLWEKLDEL
jgi:biofilm PGA synthesis N-glycosyltransferase PgaC